MRKLNAINNAINNANNKRGFEILSFFVLDRLELMSLYGGWIPPTPLPSPHPTPRGGDEDIEMPSNPGT